MKGLYRYMAARDKARSAGKGVKKNTMEAGHLMVMSFLEIFSLVGAFLFIGLGALQATGLVSVSGPLPDGFISAFSPLSGLPILGDVYSSGVGPALLIIGVIATIGFVLFTKSRGDEMIELG